jgi:dihydrofolate reductase
MRKLIYTINITIDGCCEHTKVGPPDEETFDYYIQLVRDCGLLIYGRKTYQLMVPYWPDIAKNQNDTKADIEFAEAFVAANKIVFSRSLESVESKNTRLVRTDLREEILKLKQEPGNDIYVGGVNLASQLIALGLVDEYRIIVAPIFGGQGRRLLDGASLQESLRVKLIETRTFKKSGWIALHYSKQ